jgi:hypothetical protein
MPETTTPKRRPNIFIASSTEALPVGRAVKSHFDSEADVDIWSENIFKANRNYLDTLLNRASFYDFVIAVFTADDEALIREKQVKVTRDNVVFEFGLFLGRMGPNRTFLILEEDVELFSDWSGIEVAKFRKRDNLVAAVGNACNRIREEMAVSEKLEQFSLLPSTSLAIGYCHDFLRRLFEAFETSDKIRIIAKDANGKSQQAVSFFQRIPNKALHASERFPAIERPGSKHDGACRRFCGVSEDKDYRSFRPGPILPIQFFEVCGNAHAVPGTANPLPP